MLLARANISRARPVKRSACGSVDSGVLNPGGSFRLVVDKPLAYHCEIHPRMQARLVMAG